MSLVQATCLAFPTGHRLHELLPGPPATRLLADFGADVIEIRPPGVRSHAALGTFSEGQSAVFAELNRGKKSVIADLRNQRYQRSCQGTAGLGRGTHGNLPKGEGLLEMHAL